jgi:putative tryptophan/tyrosine transport system substrate-binding protein
VLVVGEPLFVANASRLADRLRERRLLAVGGTRAYAPAGMLATYGPDLAESARRAASYVDKILKGTRPGDLPVELATKYELVVNMATARALGIAVPPTLLARADEVIQ